MRNQPKGWHLSGNNHKPHFFDEKFFGNDSMFGIYPKSVCGRVTAYSGISTDPCEKLFKKHTWKKSCCRYCVNFLNKQ